MKKNKSLLYLVSVIWGALSKKRRRQFNLTLILMVVAAFFEAASMGAIMPFLSVMTNPDKVYSYPFVQELSNFLGISNVNDMTLPLTVVFIIIITASGVIRSFLLYASTRVSFIAGADIGKSIYKEALYMPYIEHTISNSSVVVNSVVKKTDIVIKSFLMPIAMLVSASIIMFFIVTMMLVIDAQLTVMLGLGFVFAYLMVWLMVKFKLNSNSKVISYKTNKIIQSLNEGLGGIRDVIINNDQKYFLGEYAKLDYSVRKADGENYFLVLIPRYAMETIGIIIIAVAAYLSLKQGSESTNVIPVLGAFALAAQRILPVMQQFYAAIGRIANAKYSLIDVVNTLNIKSENIDFTTNNNFIFEKNITLGKISYSYPESKKLVIDDLSVTIKKGDIVGIIGKTGSGKSSLVDMIMGLLDPIKGSIRVDGVDLSKHKKDWYQLISHVPQFIHLSDSSILENIAFGSSFNSLNYDKIVRVSKVAQIYDDIVQLPNGFETKVGENGMKFSGGQIQRIGIARALYKSSSILIFDEATSALDVKTEAKIIKEIERFDKKMTVIMIAHRISTLKSCNFIINLDDKNNQ